MSGSSKADQRSSSSRCRQTRDWLQTYYGPPHIMAARFYGSSSSGLLNAGDFDPATDERLLSHARACKDCEKWVTSACGEDIMRRQRRLTKYCCPLLFGAVEEPRQGRMRIRLEYCAPPNCEGSHYWKLTMADGASERGHLLINYCPFCGNPIRVADEHDATSASS